MSEPETTNITAWVDSEIYEDTPVVALRMDLQAAAAVAEGFEKLSRDEDDDLASLYGDLHAAVGTRFSQLLSLLAVTNAVSDDGDSD